MELRSQKGMHIFIDEQKRSQLGRVINRGREREEMKRKEKK